APLSSASLSPSLALRSTEAVAESVIVAPGFVYRLASSSVEGLPIPGPRTRPPAPPAAPSRSAVTTTTYESRNTYVRSRPSPLASRYRKRTVVTPFPLSRSTANRAFAARARNASAGSSASVAPGNGAPCPTRSSAFPAPSRCCVRTNDFRAPPSFERRAVYSGLRTSTSSSAPPDTGTALPRAACAAGPGAAVCVAGAAVVAPGAAADAVAAGRAVGAVGFDGGNRTVQPIRTAAESAKARTRRFVSKGSPLLQGTGSGPPAWNGWQRASRRAANARPRQTPWRVTASRAYSEHVGVNRHAGGSRGDTKRL